MKRAAISTFFTFPSSQHLGKNVPNGKRKMVIWVMSMLMLTHHVCTCTALLWLYFNKMRVIRLQGGYLSTQLSINHSTRVGSLLIILNYLSSRVDTPRTCFSCNVWEGNAGLTSLEVTSRTAGQWTCPDASPVWSAQSRATLPLVDRIAYVCTADPWSLGPFLWESSACSRLSFGTSKMLAVNLECVRWPCSRE